MRLISTLNSYVCRNILFALAVTIFISTFVGMIGSVAKLLRFVDAGVTPHAVVFFIFYNMPKMMCYILPVGLLIATVLTFNRMSADNELTALRASGIGLFQIISPVLIVGILISGLTWWFQFNLSPSYLPRAREIMREQDPIALLEADAAMAMLPGYYVLIGSKDGKQIRDVHIYEEDKNTHELRRNITARQGTINVDKATQTMTIRLENATVITMPQSSEKAGSDEKKSSALNRLTAQVWEQQMDYGQTSNNKPVVLKPGEMTLKQLLAWVTITTANGGKWGRYNRYEFIIELHLRAAWALSPFTLLLLAIPLGLQMARRETSAGLVGSVFLAAGYYIPMTLFGETLPEKIHPEYFIWGLNIGLQALGTFLIWRKR